MNSSQDEEKQIQQKLEAQCSDIWIALMYCNGVRVSEDDFSFNNTRDYQLMCVSLFCADLIQCISCLA